jgi:hypothetical protein
VNPALDRQDRQRAWPNPVDTPLDRARRIAGMYRARLRALDRDACDELDDTAASFGETWMLEKPDIVDPDRELTTAEAAELLNVPVQRIRNWACLNHPEQPGQPLLPRFKMRGRERTYLAGQVLAAAVLMRRRSNTPA